MEKLPKEELLQHIWQYKYLLKQQLFTTTGLPIQILKPGTLNTAQGPDFFDARIKIGETLWAGNLEVHVCSSDWRKHKHSLDPAYDNIILHLVYLDDEIVLDKNGMPIPCLTLNNLLPNELLVRYENLFEAQSCIPCESLFEPIAKELQTLFFERLVIERLERNCATIEKIWLKNDKNWEACCYQLVFQYAGLGINKEPMEQLFRKIPFSLFKKYQSEPNYLQALFLGLAGLIKPSENLLQEIYAYLTHKHNLSSLPKGLWKYSGLRPHSFPAERILQIAKLFAKVENLLPLFLNLKHTQEITAFGSLKGAAFTHGITINVIAPLQFSYAKLMGQTPNIEKLLALLEAIPAEDNKVIKLFQNLGLNFINSKESQAILELKKYYCNEKRCLQCQFSIPIFKPNSWVSSSF